MAFRNPHFEDDDSHYEHLKWSWPWWKFGLERDDLFKSLSDRFNTTTISILDEEAWYLDVCDVATSTPKGNVEALYAALEERRVQRVAELRKAWDNMTISPECFDNREESLAFLHFSYNLTLDSLAALAQAFYERPENSEKRKADRSWPPLSPRTAAKSSTRRFVPYVSPEPVQRFTPIFRPPGYTAIDASRSMPELRGSASRPPSPSSVPCSVPSPSPVPSRPPFPSTRSTVQASESSSSSRPVPGADTSAQSSALPTPRSRSLSPGFLRHRSLPTNDHGSASGTPPSSPPRGLDDAQFTHPSPVASSALSPSAVKATASEKLQRKRRRESGHEEDVGWYKPGDKRQRMHPKG